MGWWSSDIQPLLDQLSLGVWLPWRELPTSWCRVGAPAPVPEHLCAAPVMTGVCSGRGQHSPSQRPVVGASSVEQVLGLSSRPAQAVS